MWEGSYRSKIFPCYKRRVRVKTSPYTEKSRSGCGGSFKQHLFQMQTKVQVSNLQALMDDIVESFTGIENAKLQSERFKRQPRRPGKPKKKRLTVRQQLESLPGNTGLVDTEAVVSL